MKLKNPIVTIANWQDRVRRKTRAFVGKAARSRALSRITQRGEERQVVSHNSLPPNIRGQVNRLISKRSDRFWGFEIMTASGIVASFPGYWARVGGLVAGFSGSFMGWSGHLDVKKLTDRIGESLRTSEAENIHNLRERYRYIIVDIEGNLVGTNKKPVFRKLGRRRIETKQK